VTTATPESNTYRISVRPDGWGTLHASGIGTIGIARKPRILRDIYTCDQLLGIGRIIGIDRDSLEAMLVQAR
jgi:hypothetical protein